jgi:hypothetical protein
VDDPHGGDAVARRFTALADRHHTTEPQTKEEIT